MLLPVQWNVKQAAQADHLEGDVLGGEHAADQGDLGVLPKDDGDVPPIAAVGHFFQNRVGDPPGFIGGGAEPRHPDVPHSDPGRGSQPVVVSADVDPVGYAVGGVENAGAGAAIEREREGLGRCAIGPDEVLGEGGEVLERRTAPFVDGLVGIADGGYREPIAEQCAQQLTLGGIGVLVFIEEDHLVAGPDLTGDQGLLCHQAMRQTDEVAVVDQSESLLYIEVFAFERVEPSSHEPDRQRHLSGDDIAIRAGRHADVSDHEMGLMPALSELADLVEAFHMAHEEVFAIRDAGSHIEIMAWVANVRCRLREDAGSAPETAAGDGASLPAREVHFAGHGKTLTEIRNLDSIAVGDTIQGPAIIESPFSAIVVDPGASATRRPSGSISIDPGRAPAGGQRP